MKKTRCFLLMASLVFATTFTISCSSDDGDDRSSSSSGGSPSSSSVEMESEINLSDLPKQVYLVEMDRYSDEILKREEYRGNGNIAMLFSDIVSQSCSGSKCECTNTKGDVFECEEDYEYDTIPVGKIQSGQLSLNLPASVNSKYLSKMGEEPCDEAKDGETCQSTFSFSKSLAGFSTGRDLVTNADIPGKSYCRLRPRLIISGDDAGEASFIYLSESGEMSGTVTYTYEFHNGVRIHYDCKYLRGWNIFYYYREAEYKTNGNIFYTSDISKTGGTLEWRLECYDN